MELSLMHAGLAAGAGLAALPVILHLFMRQKPRHVIFPALRLIRERQKRSRKKLKVKNWLLLLARMALLALMALALARPSLVSEASIGDREVPTAIALVFDTSLSMGYTQQDKTRLAEAKERAQEILKKTPGSSLVFVIDSAEPVSQQGRSPSQARGQVDGLALRAVNRPLNSAVGQAYAALAATDRPRKEVYILTDLARSAWDMERPAEGLEKVAKEKVKIKTYVLRLTPKDVRDVAVVEARPVSDTVTEGEMAEVRGSLRSLGPATSRVAELWMDGVIKDKQTIAIPADGEAQVRFAPRKVDASASLHQGFVRITGEPDPLAFDDRRYFTFRVKPAVQVLIVSDLPEDALYVANAIDPNPATLPPGSPRPFRAERIATSKFAERSEGLIKRYGCIVLNNVSTLSDSEWGRLVGFVHDGGGLVVGLGGRTQAASYLGETASQLLPGKLDAIKTPRPPTTFGAVADNTHPLFARYPKELDGMLSQVPVSKYWGFKPNDGSRVLLSYADAAPALVERVFKGSRTGRVLLWTTPLSRRTESTSADAWNEFPLPIASGWSFLYLMNQSAAYLSGSTEEGLIFDTGKDVVLPIDPTRRFKNYIVEGPDTKLSERLTPPADSDALVVVAPQQLGNWSVKASGTEGNALVAGFSVNPPVTETQFVPLETADLDKLFGGKAGYALADDPQSLEKVIEVARVGRELFPWIMFLIMIVVAVEGVLANRFYKESSPSAAPARAA